MQRYYHPEDKSRRAQLIGATIEAIAEHGISKVTLEKVVALADMTPGIVNFYFKSKNQLLLDTLQYLCDEYSAVLDEYMVQARTWEEHLTAVIETSFDERVFSKTKIAVWYAFWGESQARAQFDKYYSEIDLREFQIIYDALSNLITTPPLSEKELDALSYGFQGAIECLWQDKLLKPGGLSREYCIDICERYLHQIIPKGFKKPDELTENEIPEILPVWTYQSDNFLKLEIDNLFRPNWMLVGHVNDLPEVGSYLTFDGFEERALVIRDQDSQIRAFHNVCRHRGSKLVEGEGQCKRALVCPFHGWRYKINGNLEFIPGKQGFLEFDIDQIRLKTIDLEIWKGFIFIRFKSGGKSLSDMLKPIEQEVRNHQLDQVHPYGESERDTIPVNWKVFHDIDNEGYHIARGHPSLQQLYGKDYIDTQISDIPVSYGYFNESVGSLWSVRNYRTLMPDFSHLTENQKSHWLYIGVFPNLVFGLYPDMMEIYMTIPKDVNHTDVISRAYALQDDRREVKSIRYLNRRINKVTAFEDVSYMLDLQRGMNSSVYPKWKLSTTAEQGVSAFHKKIQELIPIASHENKPKTVMTSNIN